MFLHNMKLQTSLCRIGELQEAQTTADLRAIDANKDLILAAINGGDLPDGRSVTCMMMAPRQNNKKTPTTMSHNNVPQHCANSMLYLYCLELC